MEPFRILDQEETKTGWTFEVEVGREDVEDELRTFTVQLDEDYYDKIASDVDITPEDIVAATFEFLLSREPKESIQPTFDIDEVSDYFPDFEDKIKQLLEEQRS